MATGYLYNELNRGRKEIRLLCFDHDLDELPGILRCRIETVSLLDDPPPHYYAVSYTWGDASKRNFIHIDKTTNVSVPESSELALRYLRKHGWNGFGSTTKLWIDAVSINQSDNGEKSWQVGMMQIVFSKADTVLIWLGPDERGTAATAIASILDIVQNCKAVTGSIKRQDLQIFFGAEEPLTVPPGTLPNFDFDAMEEFYNSPWFERIWIVQEVLLAAKALCYRGSQAVDWYNVSLAAKWMISGKYYALEVSEMKKFRHTLQIHIASMLWLYGGPEQLPPSDFLSLGVQQQATIPQDKVYGILGLLNARVAETSVEITPCYGAPLREVYTRATRYALRQKDLRMLQLASSVTSPEGQVETEKDQWPSWVLRLDGSISSIPIPSFSELVCPDLGDMMIPVICDGSDSLYEVAIQGTVLGELAFVSETLTQDLTLNQFCMFAEQIVRSWKEAGGKSLEASDELFRTAFAKTIVMGRMKSVDPDWLHHFIPFMKICEKYSSRLGPWQGWESEEESEQVIPFYSMVGLGAMNRRLFTTADGTTMGLGPSCAAPNDKLCILHGADVPFVLRQVSKHWQLVGDAYVEKLTAQNRDIRELFKQCIRDGPQQQFVLK